MVSRAFLPEVQRTFDRVLQGHGFGIVEAVDSESFDNGYVIAASPDFRLRFVRDRGFVSVEIARTSAPDDWYDAEVVRALVTGGDPGQEIDLNRMSEFLDEHYSTLARMFRADAWPNTEAQIRRVGLERLQNTLPKAFPAKKDT